MCITELRDRYRQTGSQRQTKTEVDRQDIQTEKEPDTETKTETPTEDKQTEKRQQQTGMR